MPDLILASASDVRARLLRQAGLDIDVVPARVDEAAIRAALQAEDATPRDIADALAEHKARKVALRQGAGLVLGCDQVLAFKGAILAKPETPDDLRDQLSRLRGETHQLLSAAVIYDGGEPVWRHVAPVRLTMRAFSDTFRDAYIDRNWDEVRHAVGGYHIEAEGARLFSRIEGDYFAVLGLPLLELLSYLTLRGTLPQ